MMEDDGSTRDMVSTLSDNTTHHQLQIVVDEREPMLYKHFSEASETMEFTKSLLALGDVVIKNKDTEICIIERKTLQDLLASIKDGRYEEQSHRLLHASNLPANQIVYIIEGVMSQLQTSQKQLVYSSMTSLSLYKGFSVIRTSSVQETAEFIMAMTNKIKRNSQKGTCLNTPVEKPAYETLTKRVKKENVTHENIMHIMLCQIPSVSNIIGSVLVSKFQTLSNFIKELENNPHCLDGLQYTCNGKPRKVGSNVIQNIQKYLHPAAR